ncbi:MAG: LURP-one-related family protein [Gemmatimonadaceae bacterium]|nr:LURP-one-related family protein [Gemmatimonadaceae bacterium]
MRYLMRQKLLSWGNDFVIKDEAGNDVYVVDGKAISVGNQASFQDLAGNELAFIRQKFLSLVPTYELYCGGVLVAVVKRELFKFFHHTFTVDVPGPDDLTAEGDLTDHEYALRRGEREVAHVSKKWFTLADTYGVDVGEGEDPVLILATAVVVDLVCHDSRKRR